MAMADNRRRILPYPEDRLPGRCQTLGYAEAVLLTNPKDPQLQGEVSVQMFPDIVFYFLKLPIVFYLVVFASSDGLNVSSHTEFVGTKVYDVSHLRDYILFYIMVKFNFPHVVWGILLCHHVV